MQTDNLKQIQHREAETGKIIVPGQPVPHIENLLRVERCTWDNFDSQI